MQTRRDHLQAYQFAVGRLSSALVSGDTGRGDSPTRRGSLGTIFGVILVVLLSAGFAVYGLISPVKRSTWRQTGSIIVEKETGTRYLLVGGSLHPVLNYASALLLTGASGKVQTVSQDDLEGVPHGAAVGIAGAPDSLPAPAAVLAGGWTRCLRPGPAGGQLLDLSPEDEVPVPGDAQTVLIAPSGKRFVMSGGHKYPVPDTATLIALGLDDGTPLAAPDDWLDDVPAGPALLAPRIDRSGAPAGRVAGRTVKVGQVFRTGPGVGAHLYVMASDGIAPISDTTMALLTARKGSAPPMTVDAATLATASVSRRPSPGAELPDVRDAPSLGNAGSVLCLRQTSAGKNLTSRLVLESGAAATSRSSVLIPPGHGLLVVDQSQVTAGANTPQTYLVTDQATAFPLGDRQAASALRLSGPATDMPPDVLRLLKRGPVLDTAAAASSLKEG